MNKDIINERVSVLREYMKAHGLYAFVFPSTDPHCGEYVPAHWMTRQWISGFDGSAGTAVVTMDDARLWTDSRYFLAAEEQLEGTPFSLMKMGTTGTPTITEWLQQAMPKDTVLGMDGWVNTCDEAEDMMCNIEAIGASICFHLDPAAKLWTDRPSIPMNPIEVQPLEYAGRSVKSKLDDVRQWMQKETAADALVVTQLDEIAWLTNLRGTDVHCNPVFVSYLLIGREKAFLLIDDRKVTPEVRTHLQEAGIEVRPYDGLTSCLAELDGKELAYDTLTANYNLVNNIPGDWWTESYPNPIPAMKAVKNEAEIAGFRRAMVRDGVAMVKFLRWLKPAVEAGGETEMSIDAKLTSLRAEQPLYRDISFDTIAGYGPHGAIVHYEATPETDARLEPHGLLLLDSGAQYQDGTTDITRTIALGELTHQEKFDYTLVLKGHIRLALTKFPDGASGTQLDALARYAMWQQGINYGHGTGHGVGSYLCVHEGPHQIRMNWKPAPLHAGMTVTNEPGIYRAGQHGVRIENTMLITPHQQTEFGSFLQLEPLTLCPIDLEPVLWNMMLPDEVEYLRQYHQRVYDELSPYLSDEENEWLMQYTKRILDTVQSS